MTADSEVFIRWCKFFMKGNQHKQLIWNMSCFTCISCTWMWNTHFMFVGFFSYMHHNIIHLACSYYFIFRRGSMFVGPVHPLITFFKKTVWVYSCICIRNFPTKNISMKDCNLIIFDAVFLLGPCGTFAVSVGCEN